MRGYGIATVSRHIETTVGQLRALRYLPLQDVRELRTHLAGLAHSGRVRWASVSEKGQIQSYDVDGQIGAEI